MKPLLAEERNCRSLASLERLAESSITPNLMLPKKEMKKLINSSVEKLNQIYYEKHTW